MLVAQLCPTLCSPMHCSPLCYSVHWILQARILEWIAIPFSRGSSPPRDRTQISRVTGRFLTIWATGKTYLKSIILFYYIHRVVQPLPQSNFRTFSSSPQKTQYTLAVTLCPAILSLRIGSNHLFSVLFQIFQMNGIRIGDHLWLASSTSWNVSKVKCSMHQ